MKTTERDLELFKALAGSQTGRDLIDYLERLEDHIHDSRSWNEGDSKESASHAARTIRKHLRDKIALINKPKQSFVNESE